MANDTDHSTHTPAGPAVLESLWRWWASRVSQLRPEDLSTPTRCGNWAVRDLLAHATPDPDQLAAVLEARLDAPPAARDGATVLRVFNEPGGVAEQMAEGIAAAAVAAAADLSPDAAAARFTASADLIANAAYEPDAVLPYPGIGSLTAAAVTDVAIVEATVHGLDLVAAVGGPPPPEHAREHARDVLVQVAELDPLLDALTGRGDPAAVLPVIR